MRPILLVLFPAMAALLTFSETWAQGVASPAAPSAKIRLPGVFGDHMVLQRDIPLPVWGEAAPGEKISVRFRGQEKNVIAGSDGKWSLKLDPVSAGGPDPLVVAGNSTITLADVLVGEVWLGSGQSNMQMGIGAMAKDDPVLKSLVEAGPYPKIRIFGKSKWKEATTESLGGFSALLFSYGLRLQKELDVPVGLMVSAAGGSPSGFWLSEQALSSDSACQQSIKAYAETYAPLRKKYEEDLVQYQTASAAAQAERKPAPKAPVPPAEPGKTSEYPVGYFFESRIRPLIPFGIRGVLWDQGESGTKVGGVGQYELMGALIQGWRKDWGEGDFPFIFVQKPSGQGCAWDPANPVTSQAGAFAPLPKAVPRDGGGIEPYLRMMSYPNTAMVISSDLGSGLHPVNKSGYGHRAADVALGFVYGKKIEYYGPIFSAAVIEGDKIRVRFSHVGQGLAAAQSDQVQGFALAGEDKVFSWAEAKIDGDTVLVTNEKVSKPVFVRYAWAADRTWANLFNKDGLPALPFRTDQDAGPEKSDSGPTAENIPFTP